MITYLGSRPISFRLCSKHLQTAIDEAKRKRWEFKTETL
jgi:hypothetical protein